MILAMCFQRAQIIFSLILTIFSTLSLIGGIASDTISQLDCDFKTEQNYCKWSPVSAQPSNWEWGQYKGRTVNFTGPLRPVDNSGPFILSYNRGNDGSTYEPSATLVSPLIQAIKNATCFQFYYFIHGVGVDRIVLNTLNVSSGEENQIWARKNPGGDYWHSAHIHIPPHDFNFKLKFSAYAGGGAIALDKFTGLSNKCPFDGECDFESGMCDWISLNTSSNDYKFKIVTARDEGDQGLMIDHTTKTEYGHLLQAKNGKFNDRAIIVKDMPIMYSNKCLIFWYYRQKSFKNKIEVLVFGSFNQNISIWSSSLTYPLQIWHRAIVTVSVLQNFGDTLKIGISATHLDPAPIYSPINVDDISYRLGSCPEPISCDFNVDICGFVDNSPISSGSTFWVWDHGFGRVEYGSKLNFSYPPEDRTAPSDGMFLYTDFTSLHTFYSFRTMRIDSEYVSPTPASCLSFYYLAMDTTSNTTAFVINSYDNSGNKTKILWAYDRTKDPSYGGLKKWAKVQIDINMTNEFKVSFEVSTYVPNTYIALDDISYKPGKCLSIYGTTLTTQSPSMTTLSPIPHQKQVSCDFESGDFCGWIQKGAQPWSINRQDNQNWFLKPSTDHTVRNSNGRYAYVEHSSDDSVADKKSVITVVDTYVTQNKFIGLSCFSLWFYMRSESLAQLFVTSYQAIPNIEVIQSIQRSDDWGEKWNLLTFETYQDSNHNSFNITAHVKYAVVAIDDIKISHKRCSQSIADIFQCNFEEQNFSSCGFASLYSGRPSLWHLLQGSSLSQKTPDHTLGTISGHMMALDSHFDDTIASQWFSPTDGSCLSFAYLMYGLKNNETLKMQIMKESSLSLDLVPIKWSVSSDLGHKWFTYRLTIVSDLRWKIAFTGVSNNSNSGIIAIDDINIESDNPCPPPGKCDFESGDTCLWQNQKPSKGNSLSTSENLRSAQIGVGKVSGSLILEQSDFRWTVHSPSFAHFTQYPSFDHTTGTANGYYLLLKVDRLRVEGNRAILMSDRYVIDPQERQLCLSFYYYFKSNGESSSQTQLDVYQSEQFSAVNKIAKILPPIKRIDNWIPFKVTIKPLNQNSSHLWLYLVGTIISMEKTSSSGLNLAIDDISVTSGGCAAVSDTFECSPTESISKSKVCNKVKDCSNGKDEKVCGSCDFENNFLCDFQIFWNKNNPFDNNFYKWRFGDYINGPKSGADHSNGYMIARRLGPNINEGDGLSELTSPLINGAQAGCYVSFNFNIKRDPEFSGVNSTLSVLFKTQNGFETTEIWNSDATQLTYGQWMSGSAYLKRMNYNFSLIFRAQDTGQTPDSYVAIDNIVLNECDIIQTTSGNCNPITHFQCPKGCLSKYYVCDYSDDCGDNSDEKVCTGYVHRTDFESGDSEWQPKNGWTLRTGSHTLIEGQTRDHTIGTGHGHFLYLTTDDTKSGKTSNLFGPVVPQTKGCRLSMWTDIEGNASLILKILNVKTGEFHYEMTEYQSRNSFTYERQIKNLYVNDPANLYQIQFEGRVGPKELKNGKTLKSFIAIDDISLSPECLIPGSVPTGPFPTIKPTPDPCPSNKPFLCHPDSENPKGVCIEREKICDFAVDCPSNDDERDCGSCSFDKQDLCGWVDIGDSRQKWSLQNVSQFMNHPIIPNTDSNGNKSGAFIIIDTSKGGTYNTEAIISTPTLGSTAANCKLSLYYHHLSSIPLNGSQPPIFAIKLNYPDNNIQKTIAEIRKPAKTWTKVTVQIGSMSAGFQVWITSKGVVTDQTQPFVDIEIDNIQFVHCEDTDANWETTLNCTFESGTCGWTDADISTNSKLDWTRERSSAVDPGYDHTSRVVPLPQQYGYWIRTRRETGMSGNNTATLMTVQSIESSNYHCLTFWYHMWGSNSAQFALLLNQYQSQNGGIVLWLKTTPQSNNWVKESVTVQSYTPYYLMFRATLQPSNGRHEDSIGLDDITWSDGKCPNQPLCDFETNLCGWVTADNSWERTVPSHSTDKYIKPRVDHTLGLESGGYVRLVDPLSSASLLTYTFNDSTPLDDSTPFPQRQMCLKFWYYRSTASPYNTTLDLEVSTNHSQTSQVYDIWSINQYPEWGIYNEQWMFARVNLTLVDKDMIRFKGKLKDQQSFIAIDDILLQMHSCEPIGWCDFESDFCGWTNGAPDHKPNNILWLRNSGSSASTLSGPKTDHTTHTIEGWYAFVPSDSQQSGTAFLMSEPISYAVICLKFYYQISSDNKMISPKLQVLSITPKGQIEIIANINSTATNQWLPFNITHEFKNNVRYRLILKTIEGNITQSDIAVDDIQIWSDTCADIGMKSVSTQTPITSTQIPDIEKAFDCNFENNCSQWSSKPSNIWQITKWTLGVSTIGPRVDHTRGTSDGHYLLFDDIVQQTNVSYSQFVSNVMQFTNTPNCLSFWYYTDSESYFNITVTYGLNSIPNPLQNTIFMAPTLTSNSWREMRVQLPVVLKIQISINVIYHKLMVGALAIDDIVLKPGKCSVTGQVCDFSYNYCGFGVNRALPTNGPKIGFIANEDILNKYKLNGPKRDHTTRTNGNYFLFTNQRNDSNDNYKTEIIISGLSPTQYQSSCLKFWYQITGQTSNLQIFVAPVHQYTYIKAKWTVAPVSHIRWIRGQMTVRAQYEHKIVISLTKTKDDMNYIALDDISLSNGPCEPPVSCDFDTDLCDWYDLDQFADSNWKWGRFTGPPSDIYWPGPLLDHTLNKDGGTYLYMTAYRDISSDIMPRIAYIESMPIPSLQSYCLSFFAQMIGNDTSLHVFAVKYRKYNETTQTITLNTINNTLPLRWTKFKINLNSSSTSDGVELSLRIKGSFNNPNSFIALDDINLDNKECDNSNEDFVCNDGTPIDLSRVCNFAIDCSQGEDEKQCGNCDFEQGMCGWINTWKNNNQIWIRKSADNRTSIGPTVDGQSKANGYYMTIKKEINTNRKTIDYNRRAQLESSSNEIHRFKGSHTMCRMYFDYFINGSDATLRVIVREGPSDYNYVWRTIGNASQIHPIWQKRVAVDIGEHRTPFSVVIEGDLKTQTQVIAIDEITFDSCGAIKTTSDVCQNDQIKCPMDSVCIDQYSLCDGIDDCGSLWDETYTQCLQLSISKCTFELNTKCPEIFTIEPKSSSQWVLVNTALIDNLGRKTGPVNDHTFRLKGKGIYLALHGSVTDKNKKSSLVTFWMQSSSEGCAVRLFYYMYGSDSQMSSLRIYGRTKTKTIVSSTPFYKTGNLGQQWFRAIFVVNSSDTFQFVIEGQVGAGSEGDIAIDDISFSRGCFSALPTSPTTSSPTKITTPSASTSIGTRSTSKIPWSTSTQVINTQTQQTKSAQTTKSSAQTTFSTTMTSIKRETTTKQFSTSFPSKITTKSKDRTTPSTQNLIKSTTIGKTIGNKGKEDSNGKGIGPYGLTASILGPILALIGIAIGFVFYKRYRTNRSEDSLPLNPTFINLTERNTQN